jgi:GNAT superfamily N-acetyltransferase
VKAIVLRRATLRDLDVLVSHRRRMWEDIGGFTHEELVGADPVYRRWARNRLRSGGLVGWVATAGGVGVASGCVWIQPVQPNPRWAKGRQPYLLSMFTEPEFRGRGLAKRIVEVATKWVAQNGYPRFALHASEAGRPLYEALGWERSWEMRIETRRPSKAPRRRLIG